VAKVKWYPHDTGIFTSSSADNNLRVWDTNELTVVETFKFSKLLCTHAVANSSSHSLIAGERGGEGGGGNGSESSSISSWN